MKSRRMSVFLLCIGILVLLTGIAVCGRGETDTEASRIAIKILILPKFEIGELKGDVPGEAQFYYERYMDGAESYDIPGDSDESPLYVKDGVGLYLVGMGKTMAALNTMALLSDARFDFSNAWILSTGCAGSAKEYGVMGDVFLITAAVDYDLGHHADIREMSDQTSATWFQDAEYDAEAVFRLNPELMDKTYALVKDLPMETTERTRNYMSAAFNGEEWAIRDPRVLRGTTITGDNYWKGEYDHINALKKVREYDCADPYATTEMEDVAVCAAVRRMGLLDRLIILRDSVNMDVFMLGATPESLWGQGAEETSLASENSVEAADIFATAMHNNYIAGSTIIDAILDGSF